MSKVVIQGNASGTGDFTIAAPNSNTNRTLTLPDATGTLDRLDRAGNVLQVVSAAKTDTFSHNTQTFTDVTGLSATITPSSTSSKILVLGSVSLGASTDFGYIRLMRDSTPINIGDAASNRVRTTGAMFYPAGTPVYGNSPIPLDFLDSPSTTSAVTYKIQIRTGSGTQLVYINRTGSDRDTVNYEWRTPSNIIIMEIAQ
jgi:hypothetical protein